MERFYHLYSNQNAVEMEGCFYCFANEHQLYLAISDK